MADKNDGDRSTTNQNIDVSDNELPMSRVQSLARFIKNEQERVFDQGTRQQGHSLKARRK